MRNNQGLENTAYEERVSGILRLELFNLTKRC